MQGIFFEDGNVLVRDFPEPVLEPRSAIVRMKASAICRSDLHMLRGQGPVGGRSVIPGHEPCGVVEEVSDDVEFLRRGDRVAIYIGIGCGHCEYCLASHYLLCENDAARKIVGVDINGGDADFLMVPAVNCLKLPDSMSFIEGALALDTAGGLFNALKTAGASGRHRIAIFGVGPMGASGVLVAKALGATVYAVDVNEARLQLMQDVGADHVINSRQQDPVMALRNLTGGRGVDIAIDCSGNPAAQNAALDAAARQGTVVFMGESKSTTINPSDQLIRKRLTLIGGWYFPASDWADLTRLLTERHVPLEKLATGRFPLKEAPYAFDLFDRGETEKAVFMW